jgi:hypothetical protein
MDSIDGAGTRVPDQDTARVEANARLTANTGLVLLVLFVIEIATVALQPRSLLTLHTVIGLMLIPPVVLKLGSTTWRMVAYYRGVREYRRKGPPPLWLRVLGPALGVLTILVLTSGVVLILGPRSAYGPALFIHKTIFYLWLSTIALHVTAHISKAVRWTCRDLARQMRTFTPGARRRLAVVVGCVVVGAILGLALASHVPAYLHAHPLAR